MVDRRPRVPGLALALVILPGSGNAQSVDAMIAKARALTSGCATERPDAIVVCGRADADGRYRLPLPNETVTPSRPSTQGLGQTELLRTQGTCAPIGPRRCTKREALSQGLGGGRNPLAQAIRLGQRLVDGE